MGFKDMKRDDHGHVISNNETDGQKCQHQNGGESKNQWQKKDTPGADVYEREVNGEKHIALKSKNDGSIHYFKGNTAKTEEVDRFDDSPFDDDYEEEFKDYGDKAGHILNDAEEYIGEENANKIEYLINQEEYKTGMFENAITKNLEEGMSYEDALMKSIEDVQDKMFEDDDIDKDLIDAINAANDDVLDNQFGKDTPERKLVGAMKQPAGEATTPEEWQKRHNDFLERGKATWNQKLKKGDKVTFEGKDGKDIEGYIGGFWNGGKLTDEDAYEEGKDNNWHDFRGVGIVDKDGKELGNINAYQIKQHSREQLGTPEDFAKNDRQTIIDYYKQKGKDINPELLDKELKSAVHKDFKEGEQVFDTSYGGKGTPAKIVRKLSMKENLDRAGLNNPLAGDYYEIETEFLGTPSRRIVWAGRLDKGN